MKTLAVRLPEPLVADIEEESRRRKISKSDVVRERLQFAPGMRRRSILSFNAIADLVASVDGLPTDLTGRKKAYLRATGCGQKRSR
jgi:Arc/MetJ-type ribon-helix-helix transcriptional regulator